MAKRTREIDGVNRRYVWRLYPTREQDAQLRAQAAMCADLWNAMLQMIETRQSHAVARYGRGRCFHCGDCAAATALAGGHERLCPRHKLPSEFDLNYWISDPRHDPRAEGHLLRDCPEWRAMSTWTPRRVASNLAAAFAAFFRRVKGGEDPGYPRYKSRRRELSIPHRSASGCRLWHSCAAWAHNRHRDNWSLSLKGVNGLIRARRGSPGEITEWMDLDVICRDGRWIASAAVAIKPRRRVTSNRAVTVRFDLVDGLALVDGRMQTPRELLDAQFLQEQYEEAQSAHDQRWPRGYPLPIDQVEARDESRRKLASAAARIARKRKNALHNWTAQVVRSAASLTVLAPPIKETGVSVRNEKRAYGRYAVEAATEINRVALSYAPATAIAMLAYKAKEAGVDFVLKEDDKSAYAERLAIISAGARERSVEQKRRDSARAKKSSKNRVSGLDEHFPTAGLGRILGTARS